MARYRLRIDKIFIDNVRAKDTDDDELVIMPSVGNMTFDPSSYVLGTGISTGTVLDGRDSLPDPTFISGWGVDLPDVADTDIVTVSVHVNNVKHDGSDNPIGDAFSSGVTKIIAGIFAGYAAAKDEVIAIRIVPKMSIGPIPPALLIGAGVAIEAAVLAAAVFYGLNIFGKSKADCFGPVFQHTFMLPGAGIKGQDRQTATTEPWTEVTPEDCGMAPHTRIQYTWLLTEPDVPSLGDTMTVKNLRPVPGANVLAWQGTFADVPFADKARVKATIAPPLLVKEIDLAAERRAAASLSRKQVSKQPTKKVALPNPKLAASAIGQSAAAPVLSQSTIVDMLQAVPAALKFLGADAAKVDDHGRAELLSAMESAALHAASVQVHLDDAKIGGASPSHPQVAPLTLTTNPYTSNVFPSQNAVSHVGKTETFDASKLRQFHGLATNKAERTVNFKRSPGVMFQVRPSFVDTLLLPGGVSLQFYGGYAKNGMLIEHRIRYLRHNADGSVAADVMLVPVEAPLR
jgi:hypothetical protein